MFQPAPVRHVGGILLRKRLPGHYGKFDVATKSALKQEILNVLMTEPERTVRNGMVGVAASLGKLECGEGGTSWPELFQFIAAAGADQSPDIVWPAHLEDARSENTRFRNRT